MRWCRATIIVAALLPSVPEVSRAQFTTVINVPPSTAPSSIGNKTQLNLSAGGVLPNDFAANSGSELNVSGGTVGYWSNANSGSTVNVSGGNFLGYLDGAAGSKFNISGGDMGSDFHITGTTLNMTGGRIGRWFQAGTGSIINMQNGLIEGGDALANGVTFNLSGGTISGGFQLNSQSTINMTGGSVGVFDIFNSTITLSGGVMGGWFRSTGSTLTIRGGDFRVGGVAVPGLASEGSSANITFTDIITGTLADGTPFAFSESDFDDLEGTIKLVRTALPAIGPSLVMVSNATPLKGIRQGQTIVLDAGGVVGNNFNAGFGSYVTVYDGATIGTNFEASGATLTIGGGTVGDGLNAFSGTIVDISGGTIGAGFEAAGNSTLNVSGGTIGGVFQLLNGSTLNMTGGSIGSDAFMDGTSSATIWGGTIGDQFESYADLALRGGSIGDGAYLAGNVVIAGGVVGDSYESRYNATVVLEGTDFRLDGVPIDGMASIGDTKDFPMHFGAVLTCVLADGTPFAISTVDGDNHQGGFTLRNVGTAPIGPANLIASEDPVPLGIRAGQTLTADAGSVVPANFNPGSGSTFIVQDGASVGKNVEAFGATVNITGGTVGQMFDAFHGSTVTISGGTVGDWLEAHKGSTVNIEGGSVGEHMQARSGSIVNLSGGSVGESFFAATGSTVNIAGGSTGKYFIAEEGSNVTITGGTIGSEATVRHWGNLSIYGGTVGTGFTMRFGSTVILDGGTLDESSNIEGGQLAIYSGQVGDDFNTESGADVTIFGGDFRLNGVPIAGTQLLGSNVPLDLPGGAVLSGTFSDGTPFAFSSDDKSSNNFYDGGDDFAAGTLNLQSVALPSIGPALVNAPNDPVPKGVRTGQTIAVHAGGALPDYFSAGRGSTVEVHDGGSAGQNFEAVAATVNITGGNIAEGFDAMDRTVVNISGGTLADLQAIGESTAHISGGAVGFISAFSESEINITGGAVDFIVLNGQSKLTISDGHVTFRISTDRGGGQIDMQGGVVASLDSREPQDKVTISGGAIAEWFRAGSDVVELVGGEFRLNDVPIEGLDAPGNTVRITQSGVLTGVLSDGTPFVRRQTDGDYFGAFTLRAAALPPTGPAVIQASSDPMPLGIRQGQLLVADAGSSVPNGFKIGRGSAIRVEPGATVGNYLEVVHATFTMTGGSVGTSLRLYQQTNAHISGGTIAEGFILANGSTANITGGTLSDSIWVTRNSTMNVFGGSVGTYPGSLYVQEGGRLNVLGGEIDVDVESIINSAVTVSGGTLTRTLSVNYGGTAIISGGSVDAIDIGQGSLRLVGTEFALNDVPISGFQVGQSRIVSNRTGFLSGRLADGTPFRYSLAASGYADIVIPTWSQLYVSLVSPSLAGDFNRDGVVDGADYVVWRKSSGLTVAYGGPGDGNFDGIVDNVDLAIWQANFGQAATSQSINSTPDNIPEPASMTIIMLGLFAARICVAQRGPSAICPKRSA